MYNLKITGLATQRDTQSLVKTLLKVPGLTPEQVSNGLRVPPFNVLSMEKEDQVEKIKSMLEKFGAKCQIEKIGAKDTYREPFNRNYDQTKSLVIAKKFRIRWRFWVIVFIITAIMALPTIYFSKNSGKGPKPNKQQTANTPKQSSKPTAKPTAKATAKINDELKKDLVKNPYNASAWKTLSENLEKVGDTAAARVANESYERAMKAQLVLASLAKTFGNNVRVEIAEDAVYYRTSKDLTDAEFHEEAAKLRDSLNTKYPGKTLIIENYTADNRLQSVRLKSVN